MARSAAELKAQTYAANDIVEEARVLLQSAIARFRDAAVAYAQVSDKLQPSVGTTTQAITAAEEATVHALNAIQQANDYAVML